VTGARRLYLSVSHALFDVPPDRRSEALTALAGAVAATRSGPPSPDAAAVVPDPPLEPPDQGRQRWQGSGSAPRASTHQSSSTLTSVAHTLR